jgi:hypothetical protein
MDNISCLRCIKESTVGQSKHGYICAKRICNEVLCQRKVKNVTNYKQKHLEEDSELDILLNLRHAMHCIKVMQWMGSIATQPNEGHKL